MSPYVWKFWRLSWRFPANGIVYQEDWHGGWKCFSGRLFFLVRPKDGEKAKPTSA